MAPRLAFTEDNALRIAAVERAFAPSGKSLSKPGRVLVGEGRLMKLCRRSLQPKMFFLFNDIIVYGSIVVHRLWYKNQHIIPLEDIVIEDLADSLEMKNQWLLRTPKKSFYMSAASEKEKQTWICHIIECREQQLISSRKEPTTSFATTLIPDRASQICMRCVDKFTVTQRRHHCRQCGFVVCNSCSKCRIVIPAISKKPVRVCTLCFNTLLCEKAKEEAGKRSSDGFDLEMPVYEASSDEDSDEREEDDMMPIRWVKSQNIYHPKNTCFAYLE
ncbi:pleckstrin homology domain-containing family F member 1-like [Acipenser ruthenus]|uniref:pleckstrin homology domain-containing family F member 1-like n=1 Tax=Acipenser ruthenus TaxID=7906 RepID=UPI0015605453|nr:pleckstrin homology domain-containing family F member 1-like [Acipenser ruthenus]